MSEPRPAASEAPGVADSEVADAEVADAEVADAEVADAEVADAEVAESEGGPLLDRSALLFLTVLIIATCGLVYELVCGTVASYLLGDSITQFSTVIGAYLSALGIGAFLSRFIERGLARRFVEVELGVALLGGVSAPLLFLTFGEAAPFRLVLYIVVLAIGTLCGLEIPLLLRILKDQVRFKDLIAHVLTFDYIGALLASIAFPLIFVPRLGLVRTSLVFGLLNALVALWSTWLLAPSLAHPWRLRVKAFIAIGLLSAGLVGADRITAFYEDRLYSDRVIHSVTSPYQRIVVTNSELGFALYLNGNLQLASHDEYRYHEALVHPVMTRAERIERVLVLGGGDGLAVREVLRYPGVKSVVLIDIDPEMTRLARRFGPLAELNEHALEDPRVTVVNDDAFRYLGELRGLREAAALTSNVMAGGTAGTASTVYGRTPGPDGSGASGAETEGTVASGDPTNAPGGDAGVRTDAEAGALASAPGHGTLPTQFDVAIVDFPDPNNFSLGKLYTTRFYGLLKGVLADGALVTVQSTSPLFARRSFWCVESTLRAVGFETAAYHAWVPSFGEWGYMLAGRSIGEVQRALPEGLRFASREVLDGLFLFPEDMGRVEVEPNRLDNQILVRIYEEEWSRWN